MPAECYNCGHKVLYNDLTKEWYHIDPLHDNKCQCRKPLIRLVQEYL